MNYFYINFEIDELITVQKVKDACDAAADCSNELISEADDQSNYFDNCNDALTYWMEFYLENLCIWWFYKNFGDEE